MNKKPFKFAGTVTAIVIALAYTWLQPDQHDIEPPNEPGRVEFIPVPDSLAANEILELYRDGRSGVMVEARADIVKLLPDDTRGSQHQRFIVALDNDHTVLISHNIDLAPRIENLREGSSIEFRGQYEWNDRGGVVHWTHHDPRGRREGGWLRYKGKQYK